jgi:hypothetical protein
VLGGAGVAFVAGVSFEARSSGPQPRAPAAAIQATPAPAALRNPRLVTPLFGSFFPVSAVNRTFPLASLADGGESPPSPKSITVSQNPAGLGEPSNLFRDAREPEGLPREPANPEQTSVKPKAIRGPWTFELEAPG